MTLNAKAYAASRAICDESPLLVPLDVSIAALREGLSLTAPVTREARSQALRHFFRFRARLHRAHLRNTSKGNSNAK